MLLGSFSSRAAFAYLVNRGAAPLIVYALASWMKPLYHPKYVVPWLVFLALAVGWLIMRRPRLGAGLLAARWCSCFYDVAYHSAALLLSKSSGTNRRNEWLSPVHRQYAEYLDQYSDASDTFGLAFPVSLIATMRVSTSIGRWNAICCFSMQPNPAPRGIDSKDVLSKHPVLWYRDYTTAAGILIMP